MIKTYTYKSIRTLRKSLLMTQKELATTIYPKLPPHLRKNLTAGSLSVVISDMELTGMTLAEERKLCVWNLINEFAAEKAAASPTVIPPALDDLPSPANVKSALMEDYDRVVEGLYFKGEFKDDAVKYPNAFGYLPSFHNERLAGYPVGSVFLVLYRHIAGSPEMHALAARHGVTINTLIEQLIATGRMTISNTSSWGGTMVGKHSSWRIMRFPVSVYQDLQSKITSPMTVAVSAPPPAPKPPVREVRQETAPVDVPVESSQNLFNAMETLRAILAENLERERNRAEQGA